MFFLQSNLTNEGSKEPQEDPLLFRHTTSSIICLSVVSFQTFFSPFPEEQAAIVEMYLLLLHYHSYVRTMSSFFWGQIHQKPKQQQQGPSINNGVFALHSIASQFDQLYQLPKIVPEAIITQTNNNNYTSRMLSLTKESNDSVPKTTTPTLL